MDSKKNRLKFEHHMQRAPSIYIMRIRLFNKENQDIMNGNCSHLICYLEHTFYHWLITQELSKKILNFLTVLSGLNIWNSHVHKFTKQHLFHSIEVPRVRRCLNSYGCIFHNSLISTWAAGVSFSPAALVLRKELIYLT